MSSRRLELELTSARDDGTWTWRAAGAKQPKGVLDSSLLYEGAKVGDVVKAEADIDLDGITITLVVPPAGKKSREEEPNRIVLKGPEREFTPVTSSLVPKHERPRPERRGPRRDGERRDGPPRGDRPQRGGGDRTGRPPQGERGDRAGARTDRPARSERPPRPERPERPARPERARPKRLSPASKHRDAVLETLAPEHRPIAEQALRGGIPAVRRAVDEQNATLKAEGKPEIRAEPLVAIAEELLPRLKTAEWRDRAEAALADVNEIGLRDLRSVVAGADAGARDEDTRALATQLREALERRLNEQRDSWLKEITGALEEGRLVRALRVAGRAPDPSLRFPADLATTLAEAAGAAMSADAPPDRWAAVLEAVAASPVRRSVKPAALPPEPGDALLKLAHSLAGQVPALTKLLGLSMPPPPGAPRRIPPKPTAPTAPAPPPPPASAEPEQTP